MGNTRVAKFDSKGVFVKSWGSTGSANGMFGSVNAIAVDAQGNVYAADAGNKRIQVFDNNGNFKTQYTNVGAPAALCITPGPNQVLYSSNSNPPEDIECGRDLQAEVGRHCRWQIRKSGKTVEGIGTVNAVDCRSENNLLVGEVGNMRVQSSHFSLKGFLTPAPRNSCRHAIARKLTTFSQFGDPECCERSNVNSPAAGCACGNETTDQKASSNLAAPRSDMQSFQR